MNKFTNLRRLSVLVLAIALISTTVLAGTFAKYTTTVVGNGTVTAATWNIDILGGASGDSKQLTLNATDYSNVVDTKTAPGATGSFDISVKNTGEVAATYTLALAVSAVEATVAEGDATFADVIKFYYDENCAHEITDGTYNFDDENAPEAATASLNHTNGVSTFTVYWKWVSAADKDDTALQGQTAKVTATVVATQADLTSAK